MKKSFINIFARKFKVLILLMCVLFAGNVFFYFNSKMVYAATVYVYGDLQYNILDNGTVEIDKYIGDAVEVAIPSSIDGKEVTSIGNYAFTGCSGLTSIEIPTSVTVINAYAFSSCSGLTSIEIPTSVTFIDDYAFYGCSGLTSIEISANVTSIGCCAFNYCDNLEEIKVADTNTTYDSRNNCNAIIETSTNSLIIGCKKTIIPTDVTSIGRYAFYKCSGLTSIEIPTSVVSINTHAFYGCSGLTSVEIPTGVTTIGYAAFCDCSGLTSVEIPTGVTIIGEYAFSGCSGLTSIEIPTGVTTIGSSAFYSCSGLTSIEIPTGVTTIGSDAFRNCSGLTSIEIPTGVTTIDSYTFYGCTGLTSVEIPVNVTTIDSSAFYKCSGLTSIEIPANVTTIGRYTFYGCSGLTSIEIPANVTSVGRAAFNYCDNLEKIKVADSNTVYDSRNNCNAIIETSTNSLIIGCNNTVIPTDISIIGEYAFQDCSGLTSIEIPTTVTSIGNYAFEGCSGLTSVEIPTGVTTIGRNAFYGCSGLTSVEIPATITSIESNTFNYCDNLEEIKVADTNTVYDSRNNCNAIIEKSTNSLIIGCKKTEIPTGVTSIGSSAFCGCSGLTSVEIPTGVTSIGSSAFQDCSGLTSIEIPIGVTSIEYSTFKGCSGLTNIEIPTGVTSIGTFAFIECTNLKRIRIPSTVSIIERSVFSGCNNLSIEAIEGSYASIYASENGIPKLISDNNFSVLFENHSFTYDGESHEPIIKVKSGDIIIEKDKDYIIAYANNVNAGIATVTITGINNYTGSIEKNFTINKKEIADATIENDSYEYDGKEKKPSVIVKSGNIILEKDKDYTVIYSNNINVGLAEIKISGCGNYSGTIIIKFKIKEAQKEPSKEEIHKNLVVNLSKVKVLKQKTPYTKTTIRLVWNKVSGADGYEVYRSNSKNGKYKKVTNTTKTSYNNAKLKAGKNYYYKIRAYKVVDGKKIYGNFSKIKKMITKSNAPIIKAKKVSKTKIKITWKKVIGAKGYEVYLKIGAKGKYKKIKTLTTTKLTYTKLTNGKKYSFKVRSYRKVGTKKIYSTWSNVKNVTNYK